MKKIRKSIDYICVIKYLFLFLIFVVFNKLEKDILPYSASTFISAIALGFSYIPTFIIYLLSFLTLGATGLLASQAILGVFSIIIALIYKKTAKTIRLEMTTSALIGMLPFVFLGDTLIVHSLEKRILTTLLTIILTFLCLISGKAISEKGLKFKLGFEELISLATITSLFGLGLSNLISPYLFRSVSALLILLVCYLFRTGVSTIFSCVLGVSFALYYNDIVYISIYLTLSLCAESLFPISRYLSALSILMADYLIQLVFGVYSSYLLIDFISLLAGAVIFCIIPTPPLKKLKETLYSFRERQLVRQTINRNRLSISGKLFDLSGAFSEMAGAFNAFEKNSITEEKAKELMQKQILTSACEDCEHKLKCKKQDKTLNIGLSKMIDIGFAKGKLSLIDLPKELGDICKRPNNIIYGLNKLLVDFRAYAIENANLKSGRDILAIQAQGVSEVLRTLALDTGTFLKYQSRLERSLADILFKKGFKINEVLIYGEEDRLSVSLIVIMDEFSIIQIQSIISNHLNCQMVLDEKTEISDGKCFLSFKCASKFDAVYGLSFAVKDGSIKSGDTHSVTRLSNDRLLIALSDGMGSGIKAENISSTSLSLIESFYKAGLNSKLILNTVNKLLSINLEDSFTALDLSVIDLKTSTADFIKYGAPYGFIVGEKGVRIVEGNTLPLGIIDELKPSVCSTTLNDGDIIILITDGISDAFSSSGEIIDFLRSIPAKNPQTLSDDLLNKAVELNNGLKNDDMTVLAVRVFQKIA